jgi:hypothetical protein
MPIEPFDHLGRGLTGLTSAASDAPASVGDGSAGTALLIVAVIGLILLVRVAAAMSRRLPPGAEAPWTGRYETQFRALTEKGKKLPPTPQEGTKWQLKKPHSSSGWVVILVAVAVFGALCYYGQIDFSGLNGLVSTPSTPATGTPPPPAPHHGVPRAHHLYRHLIDGGHGGVHQHGHLVPQHP